MRMTRSRTRQDSRLAVLPEEIQHEILVRLPAKSVLRCRAVCRCWRRLTSAPAFLLDHHSHQPALHLVATTVGGDDDNYGISLDVVDLRAAEIQRAPPGPYPGTIQASCDGLVIVGRHIGNPTTRQWAPLPGHVNNLVGLFRHQPSGEYRVLYWRSAPNPPLPLDFSDMVVLCPIEYFVLAVGSDKPRPVKCSLTPVEHELVGGMGPSIFGAPVLLHSCLHVHWRGRRRGLGPWYHKILVFDTVAESFRQMRPLAVNPHHEMQLLDMGGTLAATSATYRMTELRIFMLQDQQQQQDVWAFRYRIKLPVMDIRRFQEEGDWWAFQGRRCSCQLLWPPVAL